MRPLNRTSPLYWQDAGQSSSAGQDSAGRAAAFRRSHHVGQILHGKVLRWVRGGMAWVHVGGQELLAQLQTKPEAGVPLRFLVEQLVPDIILKEVDGDAAATAYPNVSPGDLIRQYLEARDAFDAVLHDRLWPSIASSSDTSPDTSATAPAALAAVATFVSEDAEALALFTQVQQHRLNVNLLLTATRSGTLHYLPWLMPEAKGVELLLPSENAGTARITASAQLPACGRTLIQCLAGTERMAYRLFLERAQSEHSGHPSGRLETVATLAATVCRIRDEQRPQQVLPIACLGCGPLPAGIHDVLTSILRPAGLSGDTSGSLNRRA